MGMEEDASVQRFLYEPHWSNEQIRAGIRNGKLRQGSLKTSRSNYLEGNILVEGFEKSVLIQGRLNINRAIHDDVVAFEIFEKEQWSVPSTLIIDQEEEEEKKKNSEDDDGEESL